jgi:hypothetical protein
MKKIYSFLFCACFAGATAAWAQGQKSKSDQHDWLKNLSERITLNGYAQAGYTWQHQDGNYTNFIDLKRTLLWAKAQITDRWSFLFMYDFSSVVQEFYTDYRLTNNRAMTVRVGQFKNSYTLENPLSPTKLELVNVCSQGVTFLSGCGSDPLYGVNYGRDLGIELYGFLFKNHLYYELALMNGQGINRKDRNNQKDVIGRLDFRPVENWRVVVSGQLGKGNAVSSSVYNPNIKVGENYTRNRWSAGAEWKSHVQGVDYWKNRAATVRAEVLGGKDGDVNSFGAYGTASVPVCQALDVVGSVDYFNYNTDMDYKQTNLTAGLQHWFYKSCRLQLQYTYSIAEKQENYGTLQAQVQVAF